MVVAIIGLAAGAVVLAAADPRPSLVAEAERFGARLVRAREEAMLTNRSVAVRFEPEGYGFSVLSRGQWRALNDGPFGSEPWGEGVSARADDDVEQVIFDPTGAAETAAVALERDGRSVRVSVDAAGEVQVDG